jgi:hypothetical protein
VLTRPAAPLRGTSSAKLRAGNENPDGTITLNVVGKLVNFPGGHPLDVTFSVTILQFEGAEVGQWTLSAFGVTVCFETLLSGQIVMRRS